VIWRRCSTNSTPSGVLRWAKIAEGLPNIHEVFHSDEFKRSEQLERFLPVRTRCRVYGFDNELSSNFLEEPRSMCSHMLRDLAGDHRCSLHPEQTKYIRAITKPKLLQWISPGNAGPTSS